VHLFAQLPAGHYYIQHPHWPQNVMATITVLDMGAGGAVHVRARGRNWLFDCASERDYDRALRPYLHAAGVNRMEGGLLTHGDSLHIGGASALAEEFPGIQLIDNPARDRSLIHRWLRRTFQQRKIDMHNAAPGEIFTLSRDVSARVLHPPAGSANEIADDDALVVQLSIAPSTKVLFMSDAGQLTENALLAAHVDLRSDIIIKGQHHSGRSGSDAFLDAVRPQLIIATSRDFPQFERIADDWAASVRARGIKLFRQDETGAVELQFGERDWTARAYITGETFRSAIR
jgi:competence protein ComEC